MRDRHSIAPARQLDAVTLGAATWLACGIVLLGLTPLPWRDAALGWSPAFWLLAAPALVLVARRVRWAPRAAGRCRTLAHPRSRRRSPARRRRGGSTIGAAIATGKVAQARACGR